MTIPTQAQPVVLSYGLGVDSTAILLRWLLDPASRDFDLADLVVITAQTGNEWAETGRLVERHVYPLLAEHSVRTVQVARATSSQTGGITVLGDSRSPAVCHISGAYTLADEMLAVGTVPQTGGKRLCSVKSKGWALDQWIKLHTKGQPFRHAVGFETGETSRMLRDMQQGKVPGRAPVYPLIDWGWDREACEQYILAELGAHWEKSACSFCPYALTSKAGRERTIPRYIANPDEAMLPLLMEHVAVALNPRQGLIAGERLVHAVAKHPGSAPLLNLFEQNLDGQEWAVYDVRRAFRAHADDMMRSANSVRSVTRLAVGSRADMLAELNRQAAGHRTRVEVDGGHSRVWLRRRNLYYPCAEHVLVAAPATVADKRNVSFDDAWASTQDGPDQLSLLA